MKKQMITMGFILISFLFLISTITNSNNSFDYGNLDKNQSLMYKK
ncbi:hypothetical protein HNR74_000540 [Flammeovirga kamogawensis]|nr:hypothetical protein [Flammeovirga kamogawensis]